MMLLRNEGGIIAVQMVWREINMNRIYSAIIAAIVASPALAAPTTHAADFVKMAGASDLYEKTSSELVLKDAKNPQVRAFANMMISHHKKSTADVVAAATSDGLKPGAPKLLPAQAKMIAELKAAKPADRERMYLKQQVTAHEQALDLHSTFAKSGDKPALKSAAAKIVPVVETHLTEVKTLATM